MEAVNRVVNAASSALWGEDYTHPKDIPHGDEPISGVQGKGLANDPYDAGNREEQPGAPSSDEGNTAPQEPKLEGNPLNSTVTESSNPSKPDAGFALAGGSGSGSVYSESPKTSKAGALEQRTNTEPGPAHSSPAHVSPAAEPTSPSTTSPSTSKKEAAEHNINEDESAFEEENNGQENDTPMQSSSHPEDPHTHASKEALEGPQGPAPRSAEEFEKEMKEKKMPSRPKNPESPIAAATTSTGSSKSAPLQSSNKSIDSHDRASSGMASSGIRSGSGSEKSPVSEKSPGSNGNGKHGAMAKMKERLNKVAHPRHHKDTRD